MQEGRAGLPDSAVKSERYERGESSMMKKQKIMLYRIIAAAVIYVPLFVLEHMGKLEFKSEIPVQFLLFMIPYLIVGWDIIYRAVRNISHGQVFDENFLMCIATFGALGVKEYSEAVAVMLFYQIGELFQSYAVNRSRQSISAMMDICPEYANIEEDGKLKQVDPDDVEIGTEIVIKAGERVPLDGVVVSGTSFVDTSALTGESVPREVTEGSEIISGCVNGSGLLKVRTTKEFDDSTVAKILELVENASSKKAHVENFITKFAKYYTPIVVCAAVVLAFLPPIILGGGFAEWIQRACIFLVISCPCALVISVPLGFFGGIGAASKQGVLVKGSNYLEALAQMDTIVFDKTGTLTKAEPVVAGIVPFEGRREEDVLRLAACLEEHFPHSIANAVVAESRRRRLIHEEMHSQVDYIVAHGIATYVGNERAVIGSRHFVFEDEKCVVPEGEEDLFQSLPEEFSHLYLALGGRLAAVILIEDPLREEAPAVVAELRKLGIRKVVMMTGDSERTARAIAARTGMDDYRSEVLPEDKAAFVEQEKAEGHRVIMVGDGINDSPALSAADVGIAVSEGAQIAREIADITVSGDVLEQLVILRTLSTRLMQRVRKNYRFVIGFNLALMGLGVSGIMPPALSALCHNSSTLLVSLESMTNLLRDY